MPARTSETVYREILNAIGKVDGKVHRWTVAVFANERMLRSHVGLLSIAYKTADAALINALDPHRPGADKGSVPTEVKFSKATVQYNPTAPGLDGDAAFSD